MTAVVAAGSRILPRGWRDFGLQIVLWVGFYFSYLGVRSLVDRDPSKAIVNGFRVIDFEQRITSHFFEQTAQRVADSSHLLLTAAAWTYWNSEFTVIGLSLLWVYLRRHELFTRFRNSILLANMIGLVGYVVMPTAPPWMFPYYGFVDGVNHRAASGRSRIRTRRCRASTRRMPSSSASSSSAPRRHWWLKAVWALWPAWVWFCVLATANHFWVDVAAGIFVALVSLGIVARFASRREQAVEAVPIANLL